MSLAFLFPHEPLARQRLIPAHHPGQASYVWDVKTGDREAIVRTNRFDTPPDEDFWQGSLRLFEANTTQVDRLVGINGWLLSQGTLPVPRIWSSRHAFGHTFLVVEKLKGAVLENFDQLTVRALMNFGRHLATLHQHRFPCFGSPAAWKDSRRGTPLSQFGPRLGATLRFLHGRYHVRDAVASTYLQQALSDLHAWPHLCAAPMLLDMDASQFLHQNGEISGLIDTELYVAGPPEMELTGLEFLLSPHAAAWVRRGYEEVSPMPSLTRVRRVFRILLRMLSFQGPVPWDEWMDAPHRFTS